MNEKIQPLRAKIRKNDEGAFFGYIEADRSTGEVFHAATLPGVVKSLFAAGVRQMFPMKSTMACEEWESVPGLIYEERYLAAKAGLEAALELEEPDEAKLRQATMFLLAAYDNDYRRVCAELARHGVRTSIADVTLIHRETVLSALLASCAATR